MAAQGAAAALIADVKQSSELMEVHRGRYYPIDERRIPEAFTQWYTNRTPYPSKTVHADGGGTIRSLPSFRAGCSGLQHELALSGYPYLLFRCAAAQLNASAACFARRLRGPVPSAGLAGTTRCTVRTGRTPT